jgi:CubicO group peptidase (beta-lactamase class C family)
MADVETRIHGTVEPGWEPVRDAFAANFRDHHEVGAAVCVHVDGRRVVDLWGGLADSRVGRPWEADTLQLVFSATKGVAAVVVNHLADRGVLSLDDPVARWWPEFAAEGKDAVTIRQLLSHQAGLPAVETPLSVDELCTAGEAAGRLAAQRPMWPLGTGAGYHAVTYGDLVAELVLRVTGRSIGTVLREEIAGPLGLDTWIGLPATEEPRVAPLIPSTRVPAAPGGGIDESTARMLEEGSLMNRVFMNPPLRVSHLNSAQVHAAEQAAMSAMTTARSLSRLYAACIGEVDGTRVLSPAALDAARATQVRGRDLVLERESHWGVGFALPTDASPMLGPGSFGHAGRGGSLGCADPEAGVSFGYVMNQMQGHPEGDPRTRGLLGAVREVVGAARPAGLDGVPG